MLVSHLRTAAGIAAIAFITACGSESATAAPSVVGDFMLQTVNGKLLPYTVSDFPTSGVQILVVSPSMMSLRSNGTFLFTVTTKATIPGMSPVVQVDTAAGTYRLTGRTLSMTAQGTTNQAEWDGGSRLTLNAMPDVLVFVR